MSKEAHDIKDDEIRIISSGNTGDVPSSDSPSRSRKLIVAFSLVAAILCAVAVVYWVVSNGRDSDETLEIVPAVPSADGFAAEDAVCDTIVMEPAEVAYVAISDTTVNRVPLSIFRPTNLTPTLQIGQEVLADSTVRFAVQAADVRGDNGGIVGAFVEKGTLVSKGQAKSGFCAIIGGKVNIGVADATPFLEQALETDGYFFRQYPLVVANQIVENKPKGESLRKALAELGGEPVVIMSRKAMTFHDFSQSLVDLGVSNAIYLVGGMGYGFAFDSEGNKVEFGKLMQNMRPNTNYIVWR
ncbi:MAG: hypothetical protein NC418_06145 [Muribaculaceae bacterium]|nr:hypothetical protein [Muribaculaceae bacterium]